MNFFSSILTVSALFVFVSGITPSAARSKPRPIRVCGHQLVDSRGNIVRLRGVMDTPNPYFNRRRWGDVCSDAAVPACIDYFDRLFAALTDTAHGAYCNVFRLHLDPCWTNDTRLPIRGAERGEANISRYSDMRLRKYLRSLYIPIIRRALSRGLYVVVRPPGVCPRTVRAGDEYQRYLMRVWETVTSDRSIRRLRGVVSIELANEPVEVLSSSGERSAHALHDFFQPVVDVIRRNGFRGIIWIPGAGYQSRYEDYAKYPAGDSNSGYAVHVYPGWYGADDYRCSPQEFIRNFGAQVPVVKERPVLVTEIDWSPEKSGSGHVNEFGQRVAANLGTWGTASTSRWGNAWKAVADHYGNIGMVLSSADDFIDVDSCLLGNKVTPAFGGNEEACAAACFRWYRAWYLEDKAHAGRK